MSDDITIVKDDPEIILQALGPERLSAFLAHFRYHIVGYCVDIGRRVSVTDHEMVGNGCSQRPEVYVNDVLCFLIEHGVRHNPQIVCNHIKNVLYFCVAIQIYKYTIISESMKEVTDIHWLEEVDSTNNEALRHISEMDNLSVIAAVHQTAGRGQRGNSWLTHAGENLTFSMVVKFGGSGLAPIEANKQFAITRSVTLGVSDYLDAEGIECTVKWPNDIYVKNRKICGILIENSLCGRFIASSVIGIGLNVNQQEFPPHLVNPVSMSILTGKEYDIRGELIKLCGYVRTRLHRFANNDEYVRRLFRFGNFHEYVVCSTGKSIMAKIIGVTDSGLLQLETEKGERMEFAFKEISYVI